MSRLITRGLGTGGGVFLVVLGLGGDLSGAPELASAVALDGRHLRVEFSEPVMEEDAVVAGNYSITNGGGLDVLAVRKETATVYVLTTSLQIPNFLYHITVINIRDLDGVPI